MRPIYPTQTGTGTSASVPMDIYLTPFNVDVSFTVTGTVNFTLNYSNDDPFDPTVTPTWTPHPDATGLTAGAYVNIAFPVRMLQVVVNSGTGTVKTTIIQSGIR